MKQISKLYVASDRIKIRIIIFFRSVWLGLRNGGRALQLCRLRGRALRLEQTGKIISVQDIDSESLFQEKKWTKSVKTKYMWYAVSSGRIFYSVRWHHSQLFTGASDRFVPLQHFFGRMPLSFSIGFRWSVGRLKGRSVTLPASSSCLTHKKVLRHNSLEPGPVIFLKINRQNKLQFH